MGVNSIGSFKCSFLGHWRVRKAHRGLGGGRALHVMGLHAP